MKNVLLDQLLRSCTNSDESYNCARQYFLYKDGEALKEIPDNHPDQKVTAINFMTNSAFRQNMLRCLAFMASAKLDLFTCSDRNDDLCLQYNETVGKDNQIDLYRVLSFLDVGSLGDDLILSENSPAISFPPNLLSFLAAYALCEECSVWSVPGTNLAQTIIKEVTCDVPLFMLFWILLPEKQRKLHRDFLKYANKYKRNRKIVRTKLIDMLCYGTVLNRKDIENTIRYLQQNSGLSDQELERLIHGNASSIVKKFFETEYDLNIP